MGGYKSKQEKEYIVIHKQKSCHKILHEERLWKHGCVKSKPIPSLWKHTWILIYFTMVVEDFGVDYQGKEHTYHLIIVLKEHYEIAED